MDLSIIVTAHDETTVCGPAMTAADLAIDAARRAGFTVQAVIALDAATEQTTNYFHQPRFDHWERLEMAEGDLGRVRNALIEQMRGRFIAFLDADDLFSENWLAEALKVLSAGAERGERLIAHPELNVLFDGANSVLVNPDQDSPFFSPYYLYVRNYWDSLLMAPREAHLEIPYVSRDIPNGLSFQDFQFSIETLDAGWRHVVVRDTIIFKRRRDNSLVTESSARKSIVRALPAMMIENIQDLGRSHTFVQK